MKRARSFEARLEQYVNKTESCWLWTRATNGKGYGICSDGLVHRAAYKLFNGPIPDGKYVLHQCDVRNCCNPEHLYAGTQKDNVRDAIDRGRHHVKGQPPGERHSLSKLTEAQALAIKRLAKRGTKSKELSMLYKISLAQIRRIISGERWKHLHRPELPDEPLADNIVRWEENQK